MLKMFKGDKSFIPKNISASQFMIVSERTDINTSDCFFCFELRRALSKMAKHESVSLLG